MTYIPLKEITNAIGSEAVNWITVAQIANGIYADKVIFANILIADGVPSSPTETLIDLINKVAGLNINYNLFFTELFPNTTFSPSISGDSVIATLYSSVSPSPEPSETFSNFTPAIPAPNENGDVYLGGDATDATQNIPFVVLDVIDGTRMQVVSTAGMVFNDTMVQGANTTSLINIIDGMHIIVADTTGWVASMLVSSF